MISVAEVVADVDMTAPEPFTILRSMGSFVAGGFQNTTFPIAAYGPVQQASDKEIAMLPEADRAGEIRSFWWTMPMYVTRAMDIPVPVMNPVTASGVTIQLAYIPESGFLLYKNGLLLTPWVDYMVNGSTITLMQAADPEDVFLVSTYGQGQIPSISDVIQYRNWNYRVLRTYHDAGCGYWKAYGTRMEAA